MKKCMAGISVIVLSLLLLAACAFAPGTEADVSEPVSGTTAATESTAAPSTDAVISESPLPPAGIDRTVDISELDPFEPPAEEAPPAGGVGGTLEFGKIFRDAGELSEVAEYIVAGEVLATYYTDANANPVIYYDFKLSEVLRGDLGAGDTITVAHFGGYTRGSVFAQVFGDEKFDRPLTGEDLIRRAYYGEPFPAAGERYVLFLAPGEFTAGTYAVYGLFMGRYFLDGESVKRYVPPGEPWFYLKEGARIDYDDLIPNDPKTLPELRTVVGETPLVDKQADAG